MSKLESFLSSAIALLALSSPAPAQLCAIPCNGTQVVCHHQNGIRNHRAAPATPLDGPNATTGNVPGDAEWKIWGVENGMTRGSGIHSFTNWEIGAVNSLPGQVAGTFEIPDMELRPVVVVGGVKEPDLSGPPVAAMSVGTIALPVGGFRINLTILPQTVAPPADCTGTTGLPILTNADLAMLFLYTPGEVNTSLTYYRNFRLTTEVNTVSNPSNPPTGGGNSYSGTFDATAGTVTHYALAQELYAEAGFYEPTLEAYRQTTGFVTPTRGSGARELAAGDTLMLRVEDWQAGIDAIAGQDRLSAFLISDASAGSPVGQTPPGGGPGFFPGSALLPGSPGVAPLYPTPLLSGQLLVYSARMGVGLTCHFPGDVACIGPGIPSVFTDLQASAQPVFIPPGLSGMTLYTAAFSVNLTTLTIADASNLVELVFL